MVIVENGIAWSIAWVEKVAMSRTERGGILEGQRMGEEVPARCPTINCNGKKRRPQPPASRVLSLPYIGTA